MTRAFAVVLAVAAGMCASSAQAGKPGISMNGISMNGISMNGISMNGVASKGVSTGEAAANKMQLKGVVLPDGSAITLK